MPLVKVEILEGKSVEYKRAIFNGIHSALTGAFEIPDNYIYQQLYELDTEHFKFPNTKSDQFTSIELTIFTGRNLEAKRRLYSALVQNLKNDPGINSEDIIIILYESSLDNWVVKGGVPASEVDLGYKKDV